MAHAGKNRRKSRSAPIILILLVLVIGGGLIFLRVYEQRQLEEEAARARENDVYSPYRLTLSVDGTEYGLRNDLDTYLLIGLDKVTETLSDPESFINNQQADFLFLMIVDHTNRTYSALHVNRDTMTDIYRYGLGGKRLASYTGQLALAHTYGSGRNDSCRYTTDAVSNILLDVPIEHYLSLTMDAIPVLNDLVGGVVVHVVDDFSEVDPTLEMGKDVRLWGKHALTYVRTRVEVGDGTNLSRMARQREYINGMYLQLSEKLKDDDGFAARVASRMADFMVSDLTSNDLANLVERIKEYRFTTIYSMDGEAFQGEKYIEFYPDEEALAQLVVQLFFEPVSSQ